MNIAPSGSQPSSRARHDVKHLITVIGAAVLLVVPLTYDVLLAKWLLSAHLSDFGKFYYSTTFLRTGGDPYSASPATLHIVSREESREFTNLNPPHFHLLVLPLSSLGPTAALGGWVVASLMSFVLSVRIVVRTLGLPRLSVGRLGLGLAYGAAWVGTGSLVVTGQVSWLLLWPLTAAWSAMRERRWMTAGILVGLLASLKLFFLLLFGYLFVRRQYRAVSAGAIVCASVFLAGIAVFGGEAYTSWLGSLSAMNWPWAVMNGSALGFLARTLSASPAMEPLVEASSWVYPVWLPIALCGIAATLAAVARRPDDIDRGVALVCLACLLFSPLGWVYYSWFLIPPLASMAQSGFILRHRALVAFAFLASLWPVPLARLAQPSALATLTLASVYFWGFLALWLALLRDSSHTVHSPLTVRVDGARPSSP